MYGVKVERGGICAEGIEFIEKVRGKGMEERIYNTDNKLSAPFLLDQRQLKKLEEIVNEEWRNLVEHKDKEITRVAEEEFEDRLSRGYYKELTEDEQKAKLAEIKKAKRESYRLGREEKKVTLHLKDGSSVRLGSFSEAFRNIEVQGKKVVGFGLEIDCGEVNCDLQLESNYKQMRVTVRPKNLRVSYELFLGLKQWMDNVKAPLWQRIVKRLYGAHWFFLVWVFIIGLGLMEGARRDWAHIERAHELLENGITENEYDLAIETMLAIVSEFDKPKGGVRNIPNWYKCSLVGIILACIAVSFIPTVVIGIGKGEKTIILWRRWLRFISITVPIIFFSSFIWPYIVNFVTSFFSR